MDSSSSFLPHRRCDHRVPPWDDGVSFFSDGWMNRIKHQNIDKSQKIKPNLNL
ncbi:hypothetical protein JHK82_028530 [Glycine max]|uniref:Uncharacterized protein n=1 Tax=Glycine soja TaxID=3848 RepID=A0A0B2RFF7_GLYSO|nr:hypothetical protein JHK87_028440 [Glycine soja]KAG5127695.1 hypothetical protein JHK82_028530 [Glycine max]KAG5152307.1 hypothetical protein JHK84_028779 [Glycine max]KHN30582.1 hypothetical protein glysoja_030019 [Glycine soja]